jgi:hypothetical protein
VDDPRARGVSAALSADGRRVAAIEGGTEYRLVVSNTDGTDLRTVTPLPSRFVSYGLCWSPDGGRLRFTADDPSGRSPEFWLWETSLDGRAPRPLWRGMGGGWTPDGRFFLFARRSGRESFDLFALRQGGRPDGGESGATRLTVGPQWFLGGLAPSPAGGRLFATAEQPRGTLLRYDSGRARFEPVLGDDSIAYVDASRDGRWLAWVSFPDFTLWRSRRDGSERLQLTVGSGEARLPRWSPDGTRIAFAGSPAVQQAGNSISVVSLDGGEVRTVASPSAADHSYWDPCWLPDGHTVVFSNLYDQQPAGIHRVDVDTLRRDLLPGSEGLRHPKCGRQGQVLASRVGPSSDAPRSSGYEILRPGRQVWEPIGDLPWTYPNWSRDGRFLYGLNPALRRVERYDLEHRRTEVVAEAREHPLLASAVVPWCGLDIGDIPWLVADRSSRGLYALEWEAP